MTLDKMLPMLTQIFPLFICISSALARRNVVIFVADDAGFETKVYGNKWLDTPGLVSLSERGVVFENAFTSVSSCSPSRSAILTGLPSHQSGMFGLHQEEHHFNCYDTVRSLPNILHKYDVFSGIIGKKHVGPSSVFKFNFEETEENNSVLQVGRNITKMNELFGKFLDEAGERNFALYIGFHDPHRCTHTHPEFGTFCESFGNGQAGMGEIPDWTPKYFSTEEVTVPYFVPDTGEARADLSSQYTSVDRMDQGIQLMLAQIKNRGLTDQTLIIYTSDNGIPFPSGRTNFYDPGVREPLIVSSPEHPQTWGTRKDTLVSLLDITPTVLHWFAVPYPKYKIFKHSPSTKLTGHSLLSLLKTQNVIFRSHVFSSHVLHEVTMYYPMRMIRNKQYKLIHNLQHHSPFPIDQDFYLSPTFQDILNKTEEGESTKWYKTLKGYYYRDEWEFFDTHHDPHEVKNLVHNKRYTKKVRKMKVQLKKWMKLTDDPWLCAPGAVLENKGSYKKIPTCMALHNEL